MVYFGGATVVLREGGILLLEYDGLRVVQGGVGVEEGDLAGGFAVVDETLLERGAVEPAGVDGFDLVAGAGPVALVTARDDDLAGTGADDIVVPVNEGAGGQGGHGDAVLGVVGLLFGFALGDEFLKLGGPGGAAGCEKSEEKKAERFHLCSLIISPPDQLSGRSWSGEFWTHQRADCVVSKSRPHGEVGAT